ncbi:MAG TPA: YbjN domain-containing protein [Myxococcales bacterium]|jgi:hypothetical protein
MDATKNGEAAVETLRKFVKDLELDPQEERFPEGVAFRLRMEEPTVKAIARILVPKERFTVHFYFDRAAPLERQAQMAEFITRANYGLIIGNFEMAYGAGTLRYKASVDFTAAELVEPLIRNAMLSSMDNIETFAGPLFSVLDGAAPEEAFASAQKNIIAG